MIPERTVARLSRYRRLLLELEKQGSSSVFSHQLATLAGVTAAQVRRDLMVTGYLGSPTKGYNISELVRSIGAILDAQGPVRAGLVGIGNLGRAILAYFVGRRPNISIVAAFDDDPDKAHRVIHGCWCYPVADMAEIVRDKEIRVGIVAVPASAAQATTDTLVTSGVTGILNFAPVTLVVPAYVYVENVDLAIALEKVSYFARTHVLRKEA